MSQFEIKQNSNEIKCKNLDKAKHNKISDNFQELENTDYRNFFLFLDFFKAFFLIKILKLI